MKVKGITTIDSEINFWECQIDDVPEKIKKLFPNQNLVKVTEKGKSYISVRLIQSIPIQSRSHWEYLGGR